MRTINYHLVGNNIIEETITQRLAHNLRFQDIILENTKIRENKASTITPLRPFCEPNNIVFANGEMVTIATSLKCIKFTSCCDQNSTEIKPDLHRAVPTEKSLWVNWVVQVSAPNSRFLLVSDFAGEKYASMTLRNARLWVYQEDENKKGKFHVFSPGIPNVYENNGIICLGDLPKVPLNLKKLENIENKILDGGWNTDLWRPTGHKWSELQEINGQLFSYSTLPKVLSGNPGPYVRTESPDDADLVALFEIENQKFK